jgi:tetratricopeptide (TPR) repeat protein
MTTRRGHVPHAQHRHPAPPLEAFRRSDVFETLACHPDTRPHVVDAGFREALSKLRTSSHEGGMRLIQHDPRLVQAMGVLNGHRVSATEADVRAAERVGDIKKRDAIQTADVEAALQCATVAEAKAAGNEHFKAGAHSKALACYARARVLLDSEEAAALAAGASEDDEDDKVATGAARSGTTRAVLLSNSAAALLRLERPAEALQAGLEALSAAPPRSSEPLSVNVNVLSKIHYRLAHAYEQLQRYDEAVEAMRRSLEHARGEAVEAPSRAVEAPSRAGEAPSRAGEAPSRAVEAPSRAGEAPSRAGEAPSRAVEAARGALHPSSLEWSAASDSATTASATTASATTTTSATTTASATSARTKLLADELRRLECARRVATEAREDKERQARREAVAQARREAGVPLAPSRAPANGAEAPSRAAEGAKAAALAEHDFSHWARRALAARLGGLRHARAGATVVVDRMDDERSEVTLMTLDDP